MDCIACPTSAHQIGVDDNMDVQQNGDHSNGLEYEFTHDVERFPHHMTVKSEAL